jgi:hypothetical protein
MDGLPDQDGILRLFAEENGGVYRRFATAADIPRAEMPPR